MKTNPAGADTGARPLLVSATGSGSRANVARSGAAPDDGDPTATPYPLCITWSRSIAKSRPACARRFAALTLSLGLAVGCYGATAYQPVEGDPLVEPWRWRSFPDLNGMGAQCMTEAADGAMWFGTVEGVWRYDGLEWTFLQSDVSMAGGVTALCRTADGSMYLGSRSGLGLFVVDHWTYAFPGAAARRSCEVRKIAAGKDGSVWAATSWGLVRGYQSKWTLYTDPQFAAQLRSDAKFAFLGVQEMPANILTKARPGVKPGSRRDLVEVSVSSDGLIWLGTGGGEIIRFDADRRNERAEPGAADGAKDWSIYNEADGLVTGRAPSILPLRDGTVWVAYGTGSGQMNVFNGSAWTATPLAEEGMPPGGSLLQTGDGVVWLSGRYVLSAYRDGKWRVYQKPEIPIPTAHNFVLQSADGALWIAGHSTEILRVDYQTPRWLTLRDLNFQWESPTREQWFLHRSGRVVVHTAEQWISYGAEDGVMDAPTALVGTRDGMVWVAGSHQGVAATARYDGKSWHRVVHDRLSWGIDWRGVMVAADGSVWFSATVDSSGPPHHANGILQFKDGAWIHHHQPGRSPTPDRSEDKETLLPATQRPEPIGKFFCLGESADRRIWAGRNLLVFYDGAAWSIHPAPKTPKDIALGIIETMYTTREGHLWFGTRQAGAVRYDGRTWERFQGKHSLVANTVRSLTQTVDGSIWAATDRDISRFDGSTWTANVLPEQMNVPNEAGSLKAAPSGALWINRFAPDWMRRAWPKSPPFDPAQGEFWTVRHQFDTAPPETAISAGSSRIAQPGNLSVLWSGAVPWRQPNEARLQYSFRLDDQPWSPFTSEAGHAFFTLPQGAHHLEVRARNSDFIVDPTPAVRDFVVLPPVWRQGWFIALMVLLGGLIIAQSVRVLVKQQRLTKSNRALADEIREREQAEAQVRKLNAELEQRVANRTAQLEMANKELEAFSYSVSHDLRAPLRSIDGFSRVLLEDYPDKLDDAGKDSLNRICAATRRMGHLIDAMLKLARVSREEMRVTLVDLSALAANVAEGLRQGCPDQRLEFVIAPNLAATGDMNLLEVVLENLFGNACKFARGRPIARIEFGVTPYRGTKAFFVRDNGAGFDMTFARTLFGAFQRFHSASEFPGTGIGLATVKRIIHRHGGQVSAESQPDAGATFFFTLPEQNPASP